MPAVIVGNVSLQANLDHDHDELCCKAFEEILESCLLCVQSAFAEFARLGVGEVHKVGVTTGQYPGRSPKVKTSGNRLLPNLFAYSSSILPFYPPESKSLR